VEWDYIDFPISTPRACSGLEAARVSLARPGTTEMSSPVHADGEREYWATNELDMRPLTRTRFAGHA
jgi:hypothetical protein